LAARIVLTTGCRVGEVSGITLSEVTSGEWCIPAERTKAGRAFVTYLHSDLIDELERLAESFPLPENAVSQATRRICKQLGMPAYSAHDMRRTVGTVMARKGVAPDIRSRFLNHAATGVTDRHYNVYDYAGEKLEVADMLQAHMAELGILPKSPHLENN